MCLAIPGKIVALRDEADGGDALLRMAEVDFGGVTRDISLAYTPEAQTGEWVIVHVGFAISVLDEAEAQASLTELRALAEFQAALDAGPGEEPAT